MRVPTEVLIGGKRIKIRYLKTLPGPVRDTTFGEFCCSHSEIRVNKGAHHNAAEVHHTIYHELTHAVFKISGLENIVNLKTEEAIVSAIENMMAPLFVFSPEAKVKYREVKFSFEEEE